MIGHISGMPDEEVSDEADEYALFHIGNSDIYQSNTEKQKLKYTCEVSVISRVTLGKLQAGTAKLVLDTKKKLILSIYSGETISIEIAGVVQVEVCYKDQKEKLSLVVTEGNGPSLLGKDWMQKLRLHWCKIFAVKKVEIEAK